MIRVTFLAVLAVTLLPTIASAQMVAPPAVSELAICPGRPDDPVIIQNMDVKDAHKTLLIQGMYKAVAYQDIVDSGSCSCEQRFPSWEPIVEYYLENYAGQADYNTVRERRSYYRASASANRPRVRDICIADGNW